MCLGTTALPVCAQQAKTRGASGPDSMSLPARGFAAAAPLDAAALPRKFPASWTKSDRLYFLLPHIITAAQRNGVDAQLLTAVCDIETSFQPDATSPKGARGLTQMMPATAARFGVRDAYDLRQALDGSAKYLRFLTELFDGNLDLILAGYNSGEGSVIKYGRRVPPYAETQGYVERGRVTYLRYLQALPGSFSYAQQAGGVRLASYVQNRPAPAAVAAPVDAPAPQDEPQPVTRSIVYGEPALRAPDGDKEKTSASPAPGRVTRSIKFQ